MAKRHTPPVFCFLPTHIPADQAEALSDDPRDSLRRQPAGPRLGRLTIDRMGITLSCPRCGDHRSVYPVAAGEADG